MKQVVHIIRKDELERKQSYALRLEQDYELASLFDAMQRGDEVEKEKSILRLKQIHEELEALHVLVQ
ncbi:hypothetical protein [Paenisporosarcina cavernae]|uniref:Uncharacterized protein n=1 Tax=Paenisporosarcina cavernae TaxID=2320858 RepID=A0A385YUG6_9BACL|nr:hypothetical protein [Paenisporosarcina cavernae]AYC29113.1 hypothetical protein D3873_04175 [Paenisporosarcina cavernae]